MELEATRDRGADELPVQNLEFRRHARKHDEQTARCLDGETRGEPDGIHEDFRPVEDVRLLDVVVRNLVLGVPSQCELEHARPRLFVRHDGPIEDSTQGFDGEIVCRGPESAAGDDQVEALDALSEAGHEVIEIVGEKTQLLDTHASAGQLAGEVGTVAVLRLAAGQLGSGEENAGGRFSGHGARTRFGFDDVGSEGGRESVPLLPVSDSVSSRLRQRAQGKAAIPCRYRVPSTFRLAPRSGLIDAPRLPVGCKLPSPRV